VQHTAITAEKDLSHSVGRSWHVAIQKKLTFFMHRLGARIIAAMGIIRVEAEGDELQLLGQKKVTVQSYGDWVHITGKKGVLINGGGSYLKVWDGGVEYGTGNGWVVYSMKQEFAGPRSLEVPTKPFSALDFCLECWLKAMQGQRAITPFDAESV
jgi:type VI secretion system secreted protein VgrG